MVIKIEILIILNNDQNIHIICNFIKMIKISYNESTNHYGNFTHYEKPERINFCISMLKKYFTSDYFIPSGHDDINQLMNLVQIVHKSEYILQMMNFKSKIYICRNCEKKNSFREKYTFSEIILSKKNCVECNAIFNFDNIYCFASVDTYYTYHTFHIALEAVGVIKNLLEQMNLFETKYTFALVRPPGHHCNNDPNGFCIFNNVYVGAKYAQKIGFNKVLILDIDFHHGDGTQKLIESNPDPNISFVSIHGFGKSIYPRTGAKSNLKLNILNIPLGMDNNYESRKYITDNYYQNILDTKIFSFICDKEPDLIIVSLGFDAHQDDPLEGMNITDSTYLYLTLKLKQLAKKVMFVLEGGYNVKTIARIILQMINLLEN